MLDFYTINAFQDEKTREITISPKFKVMNSKDLMIKGGSFYSFWNPTEELWSTDINSLVNLIDNDIYQKKDDYLDYKVKLNLIESYSSKKWTELNSYLRSLPDNFTTLDNQVTFHSQVINKEDHISKKLSYDLSNDFPKAYNELMSVLYDPLERKKIEWGIGSILTGASKNIQKFFVLYGPSGSGKSTILNIIQMLFDGYYNIFEARQLGMSSAQFALEQFKNNPLVSIDHDGDLSRLDDNTKLNSLVSHEIMVINEKFKAAYSTRLNTILFIGTNRPVRITDSKSGLVRRLIDVSPSGNKLDFSLYSKLMKEIRFELGSIANHCINVFNEYGEEAYNNYIPTHMLSETNEIHNFVEEHYESFSQDNGTTLNEAWSLYKTYCDFSAVRYPLTRKVFREELREFFHQFSERLYLDGKHFRNLYRGFKKEKFAYLSLNDKDFNSPQKAEIELLRFDQTSSIFDDIYRIQPAQYANENETPVYKWDKVSTVLEDLDSSKLHYVLLPNNHIVIDFDIKDENGNKSFDKNLVEASKWPRTYSEISKSGNGIHLHYIYDGDTTQLDNVFSEGIEIKTFGGKQALRRRYTASDGNSIEVITSGLPLKKDKKMIDFEAIKTEKGLRTLIRNNLNKEIHPGTKPSIDFIYKILEDAYSSGLSYDLTDIRQSVLTFAMNSTNHSEYCVKIFHKMKFKSEENEDIKPEEDDKPYTFFDVEVFPNLFVVVFKREGGTPSILINPSSIELEPWVSEKLIGFNCRKYDNHILYARLLGYNNDQLYRLSQKIINNSANSMFKDAYRLSYADIYDFSSKKQSLKAFQVELGLNHDELGLAWDEKVPEELWDRVAEYCANDVSTTELVFRSLKEDFSARKILSELSGLSVNDTTQRHAAKIIFGDDKNYKDEFVYTDLSKLFPGYIFDSGKSVYLGKEIGEGGYVSAEHGYFENVLELDIESMHPTSIIELNLFGKKYTKRFAEIRDARLAIKHNDISKASKLLNKVLVPYLQEDSLAGLANALKLIINIVYGLTSASFDNPFRDIRNKDNIVAKRGALFMRYLENACEERGLKVLHIKTDSIKFSNISKEDLEFVIGLAAEYGYTFKIDHEYDKFCLINDAVYIAKKDESYFATGAMYKEPYVLKTLFTKEEIVFDDYICVKTVKSPSVMYLDFNETLNEEEHNYHFIGKAGAFIPVINGFNGGRLLREKDNKYYAVTGTKGYRWKEAKIIKELDLFNEIDIAYFNKLAEEAKKALENYVSYEAFIRE